MRRFVQSALRASIPASSVRPGDPLPHLRRARLCVHPAYEDGFGYAPAEALAAGVPVIVSEDTGMKELIDSPRSGPASLPTGDLDALTEAIDGGLPRRAVRLLSGGARAGASPPRRRARTPRRAWRRRAPRAARRGRT